MTNLKICVLCKASKSLEDFNKKQSSEDGKQNICRDCNKKKSKDYYSKNKEKHKKVIYKRRRKHVIALQQYTYDFLKMHGCAICGENDPCCLDFDHLKNKNMLISKLISSGYSFSNLKKEIDKCQILCANCHRRKTAKDFNWYKNIKT